PGFSEKDRNILFEKGVKLSAKPTGNESSHSLGLYIVKKLSMEIGVKVELIESSTMGSTFEVAIPVEVLQD
ncbi:MAG: ATP-binding protein, partial [Fulvivirga sp.]